MMNEYVRSIMTSDVVTLNPHQTLAEARAIFMDKKIHHIPIVNGRKLVGLITSWDLFKLGKSADDYASTDITEVMTTKIAPLDPDQHIGAAAEVLMEHLFHAVPIVDDEHNLLGIITTYDILKYEYSKEYPDNLEKFIPENM